MELGVGSISRHKHWVIWLFVALLPMFLAFVALLLSQWTVQPDSSDWGFALFISVLIIALGENAYVSLIARREEEANVNRHA